MKESGVEQQYTAHSTGHASTSKALSKGLDLNIINKAAGWSKSSKVFARFYNRPIKDSETFPEILFS